MSKLNASGSAAGITAFFNDAAAGGIVLMVAAALALIVANSPLGPAYAHALHVYIGGLSLLHWINDGLMALFFLMVGLEIKREMLEGELSTWQRRVLPGFAALGGMIAPALIFLACNLGAGGQPKGWAIPAATDIAFSLGVLALLGSRVAPSLRLFLTALAIIDDLGAILIIAFFYSSEINLLALGGAAIVLLALGAMNYFGVRRLAPYLLLGAVLWFLVLHSGVHATLAGVALALFIPLKSTGDGASSPLHRLEHGLHPWVTFLVVPVFGFANAGVSFAGLSLGSLADPVPLGVALGLFLGKQIGVFGFSALAIGMKWAVLPNGVGWRQLYGVALLCGIGFTMSLFIGLLAFPGSELLQNETKLGVFVGSLIAGLVGALILTGGRRPDKA
jgi:NhaA family Na+:H+ antiporter